MRTFRGTIAYDGTEFSGFQRQSSAPTIQGALEGALEKVTGAPCAVVGAGRTDAGVHARGQVISFASATRLAPDVLQRALNATLPGAIVVRALEEASSSFNARYDARSRAYEYVVYNAALPDPFWRRYSHHVPDALAAGAMDETLRGMVGEHDFAAFGMPMEKTRGGVTVRGGTIRTLLAAGCRTASPFVYFYVEANAFLRHMVRQIVGTVLKVGRGRLTPHDVLAILRDRRLDAAGPSAPAQGLYLSYVRY